MPEYQETADDLAKKYHNTFVLYNGKPAYVHHFEGEAPQILCHVEHYKEKVQVLIIKPEKLEPIVVNTMFVNNNNFKCNPPIIPAVLLSRKPKRQWRRGLCAENTLLRCPVQGLYAAFDKQLPAWDSHIDWKLITNVLNPYYPSLAHACELVETCIAVAVSPLFCVTLSSISPDKYLLASHFGFIGECQPNRIWVHHPAALQEVRDFVQRTKQSIEVSLDA